jgi:integrase
MRTRNPNGMGTITKRKDGRYVWKRVQEGQVQTDSDMDRAALEERIRKKIGLPVKKTKVKVDEWFQSWLTLYVKPIKKEATYEQYRTIYEKHIQPVIGKRLLYNIQPCDIQAVIADMAEKTRKIKTKSRKSEDAVWIDSGQPLSTWTMKHARKIMNSAFERAVKERFIPSNPVIGIEIPKRQPKVRKTLNSEELAKLFTELKKSRWIWSAKFMLVTALRRGELLALRWSDIDFVNKRITVDESRSSSGVGDTKSSKVHYVPLSKKAEEYLSEQKRMLEEENNPILNNEELKKTNLVFPSKSGTMMQPNSYYTMLSRYAKEAGIYATPHCLRHTFVYMNRKKLSLKEIQYILGHDESTTTLDIYGDIISDSTDETARQLDEVFADIDKEIEKKEMAKVIDFMSRKKKA